MAQSDKKVESLYNQASRAYKAFSSGEHEEAKEILDKLTKLKPDEGAIVHNAALNDYLLNDKQSAGTCVERIRQSAQVGSPAADGALRDYNEAVLESLRGRHKPAMKRLELLLPRKDLGWSLTSKVNLLALDIYLKNSLLPKAKDIISFLESEEFVQSLPSTKSSTTTTNGLSPTSANTEKFMYLLHMHRTRYFRTTGDLKQAKKEAKSALQLAQQVGIDASQASANFLKSGMEYEKGNVDKCLKQMVGFKHCLNESALDVYYNNMGCLHYKLGKFGAAQFYYSKALKAHGRKAPQACSSGRRCKILYNCAISLMRKRDYHLALQCLKKCSTKYADKPECWVRMAECCIQHHREGIREHRDQNVNSLVRKHLPPGDNSRGHRLLLPIPHLNSYTSSHSEEDNSQERDLSLKNAVRWLQIADSLLQRTDHNIPVERHQKLRRVTLVDMIYCLLGLGCPVQAIQDCERLLSIMQKDGNVDETTKFVVHQYLAEAMCMAGRAPEAASKLDPASFPQISTPRGIPHVPQAAYVLYSNLATCYIVRGEKNDLSKAHQCVKQILKSNPSFSEAQRTLVYLHLRAGNTLEALQILKYRRPILSIHPQRNVLRQTRPTGTQGV